VVGLGRLAGLPAQGQAAPGFVVVAVFPHDSAAFTEGLAFGGGVLFEGTGLDGHSDLRQVDLVTGEVTKHRQLADRYFGEGVTVLGDRAFQLTWQDHKGWVYRAPSLVRVRSFDYRGEGWGLTDHAGEIVMSNGSDVIRFRDRDSFRVLRSIHGGPVDDLNELEWVGGEIFANVFPTDDIVRIDPATGEVVGRLSLAAVHEQEGEGCSPEVANGIAYLSSQDRLFVTGKYWCHVYEIRLDDPPGPTPSPTES
jgi:glutamine cyclotransferase